MSGLLPLQDFLWLVRLAALETFSPHRSQVQLSLLLILCIALWWFLSHVIDLHSLLQLSISHTREVLLLLVVGLWLLLVVGLWLLFVVGCWLLLVV